MIARSYFIPTDELTLTDIKTFKEGTIRAGIDRAIFKKLGANEDELAIRDIRPSIELPTAFAAGDRWIFPAPAAAVAAAFTTTVWINEALPVNRVMAIYGIAVESAAPEVSMVLLRGGAGGLGRTAAVLEIEKIYTKINQDGFLATPVTYDPQETVYIQVINRIPIAAAGTILQLKGYVVEPRQEQVS